MFWIDLLSNNMQTKSKTKDQPRRERKICKLKDQSNKISNLKNYKRNFFGVKYIAGCTI
jgi:hypothetical protein